MFFNKPVFKFYSFIPEILENYPIIKAKNARRDWFKTVTDSYKKKTNDISQYGIQMTSASKCPGIIEVNKLGWILTSWFDFTIETHGDKDLKWSVPSTFPVSISNYQKIIGEPIKYMDLEQSELKIPLHQNTFKLLVKISMPWVVDIPKGWNILMLPVSYSDDTRFFCSTGILKPGSFVQVHPQLFLNKNLGPQLIKAGTPLCQLIPVPESSFDIDYKCLNVTEKNWKDAESFFIRKGNTFIRDPNVR